MDGGFSSPPLKLSLEGNRKSGYKLLPGTCRWEKNLHSFEDCLDIHHACLKCSHSVLTALRQLKLPGSDKRKGDIGRRWLGCQGWGVQGDTGGPKIVLQVSWLPSLSPTSHTKGCLWAYSAFMQPPVYTRSMGNRNKPHNIPLLWYGSPLSFSQLASIFIWVGIRSSLGCFL